MRISKLAKIGFLVLSLSVLCQVPAQACSPSPPMVRVYCGDDEYGTEIASWIPFDESGAYDDLLKQQLADTQKKLVDLNASCSEDLSPVVAAFEQVYKKWLSTDGSLLLTFMPYSS